MPEVGGHVIAHASTVRLSLRKGKAEQRIMKVCIENDVNLLRLGGCHVSEYCACDACSAFI